MRKTLAVFVLYAVSLTFMPVSVSNTLTGCLARDKGVLYYIVEGNSPSRECSPGDRVISFNQIGPQGPPGAAAQAPRLFRFVGVTTQGFNGAGSYDAMTKACTSQYPGSRMATTEEYHATVNPPTIAQDAWITPSPKLLVPNSPYAIDESGATLLASTNWPKPTYDCGSWTISGGDPPSYVAVGAVLTPGGAITDGTCAAVRAVACSAPEPQGEPLRVIGETGPLRP